MSDECGKVKCEVRNDKEERFFALLRTTIYGKLWVEGISH